jgi:hypothetical protein
VLGLQVQRFVEQQQISLKWITQGLWNSRWKRSKLSLSNNPVITIQEVSCVPNTPNILVRCIGSSWHKTKIKMIRRGHYSSNNFQDSTKRKSTERKTLGYHKRGLFFNAFELGAVI